MKIFVILSAILAVSVAVPFIDRRTANIPRRVRREEVDIHRNTKFGLKDGVPYVKQQVNLANSADHKLDANALISKDIHNNGPTLARGSIDYLHKPSGGGLQITGSNVPGGGTNVGAAGVWNLYRNGGFGVDLKGGYSQQFGGPYGNSPPIYGVEIQGGYAFPRRG